MSTKDDDGDAQVKTQQHTNAILALAFHSTSISSYCRALLGGDASCHIMQRILSTDQIETFRRDGVLVVEDILTPQQVDAAIKGLETSLLEHGVDVNNLLETGRNLKQLSSTNGSGGVLDLVYDDWKLKVAMNERLFQCTTELWEASYCHKGEGQEDLVDELEENVKWHPFGAFDCARGYVYMDRVGYRIPTALAEQLGHQLASNSLKNDNVPSKNKVKPIQRCLTPHLDCCPETFHSPDKTKWRPIQCMVALTNNMHENTGGFEAALGFHREFDRWSRNRPPSEISTKSARKNGTCELLSIPAPCVGEYTHIRPKEDADIMRRMQHILLKAGCAVFWDNRIPHANAYRHDGNTPRCVVYCSFLPDVHLNRTFVAQQLQNWRQGLPPIDTKWMHTEANGSPLPLEVLDDRIQRLTTRERRLLGIEQWP
jgi:hypothetical protein